MNIDNRDDPKVFEKNGVYIFENPFETSYYKFLDNHIGCDFIVRGLNIYEDRVTVFAYAPLFSTELRTLQKTLKDTELVIGISGDGVSFLG